VINRFQTLLSISTCAATAWDWRVRAWAATAEVRQWAIDHGCPAQPSLAEAQMTFHDSVADMQAALTATGDSTLEAAAAAVVAAGEAALAFGAAFGDTAAVAAVEQEMAAATVVVDRIHAATASNRLVNLRLFSSLAILVLIHAHLLYRDVQHISLVLVSTWCWCWSVRICGER
jgi:hypothetical protein